MRTRLKARLHQFVGNHQSPGIDELQMVKSAKVAMYQVTFPRRRLCASPGKLYNENRMAATLWKTPENSEISLSWPRQAKTFGSLPQSPGDTRGWQQFSICRSEGVRDPRLLPFEGRFGGLGPPPSKMKAIMRIAAWLVWALSNVVSYVIMEE